MHTSRMSAGAGRWMDSPELVKFSPISLEGFHVTTVLLVLAAHTGSKCPSSQLSQCSAGITSAEMRQHPGRQFWSLSGTYFGQLGTGNKAEGVFSIAESQLGETRGFQGSVGSRVRQRNTPCSPRLEAGSVFYFNSITKKQ